jgi:periplasmic protein TonB
MTWKHLDVTPLLAITASLALHLAIVGGILLGAGWGATDTPVLLAELVVPEEQPEPPPRVSKPRSVVPDRRPVTPPRPTETPVPAEAPPAPPPAEPEPPRPSAPEPPPAPPVAVTPAPPAPAPVAPPAPVAASTPPAGPPVRVPTSDQPVGAAATSTPGTFTAPLPPSPPATGRSSALATVPSDGITQRALPRGGYQYRPSYPSSARASGIQGTTLLEVLVTVEGRVTDVVVKESAGHPALDEAAVDAVRRWRFEPARRGSEPVAMRVELPFEFRLRR